MYCALLIRGRLATSTLLVFLLSASACGRVGFDGEPHTEPLDVGLDADIISVTEDGGADVPDAGEMELDAAEPDAMSPVGEMGCNLPTGMNENGCSGSVLATGSMNQSDSGSVAAMHCENNYVVGGSCCSFSLFGAGEWYLTNGQVVSNGGTPDVTAWGRSAGACSE